MLCSEIMKNGVECVSPEYPVEVAARKMRDYNIGFLPVCDQALQVVGVITDRDIAIRVVASGRPGSTAIRDVMTNEVVACKPGDDVSKAERMMGAHQKSRIMCIDDDGKLVGVISLSDIAQREDSEQAAETMKQVSQREARVA